MAVASLVTVLTLAHKLLLWINFDIKPVLAGVFPLESENGKTVVRRGSPVVRPWFARGSPVVRRGSLVVRRGSPVVRPWFAVVRPGLA